MNTTIKNLILSLSVTTILMVSFNTYAFDTKKVKHNREQYQEYQKFHAVYGNHTYEEVRNFHAIYGKQLKCYEVNTGDTVIVIEESDKNYQIKDSKINNKYAGARLIRMVCK